MPAGWTNVGSGTAGSPRAGSGASSAAVSAQAGEVLLCFPRGLEPSALQVELAPAFDRQRLWPDDEARLEKVWKDRLLRNPRLFNGSKFRFHEVLLVQPPASELSKADDDDDVVTKPTTPEF